MLGKEFNQRASEFGTAVLVLISAGLAGREAAHGMSPEQVLGAAEAILGSVMAAVMVRLWPAGHDKPQRARVRIRKDD